jgi:tripartite-type tricarboxylate transporter receptor subunit TctC
MGQSDQVREHQGGMMRGLTTDKRRFLRLAAGAAALPTLSRIALAQAYPARPITIVVPFAPGGISDVMARKMAGPMRTFLGQPVIIENVGGAGGSIGVGRANCSARQ